MDDFHPDDDKDIICGCSGTTVGHVKKLIDKGVADLERISRATGACSGCGGCEPEILALLAEYPPSHP